MNMEERIKNKKDNKTGEKQLGFTTTSEIKIKKKGITFSPTRHAIN